MSQSIIEKLRVEKDSLQMRIAVFGTGGVGGYFGGRLAEAGEDVIFIARGDHLRAIKEKGLKVDSRNGDFVIYPAAATDTVSDVGVVDLVLVGVKAWQVPEAALAMQPLVGANTTVLPLQNGVDAASQDPVWQVDISDLEKPGTYTIAVGDAVSDPFTIAADPYARALVAGLRTRT